MAIALAGLAPSACVPAAAPSPTPTASPRAPSELPFDLPREPLPELAVLRFGSAAFRHDGSIHQVVFAGNGKSIATGGDDGSARVWDLSGTQLASTSFGDSDIAHVGLSFDGRWLAAQAGGKARVIEVASGRTVATLGERLRVDVFAFSPDGARLAGSGAGRILLWSTASWQIEKEVELRSDVTSRLLRFTGNDRLIAARPGPGEGEFELFNALDGAVVQRTSPTLGPQRGPGALDPEGLRIAACDARHRVVIHSIATGKEESTLPAPADSATAIAAEVHDDLQPPCAPLVFSPDGRFVVTSSPLTGLLKRPLDGTPPLRLSGPTYAEPLAISPDARLIVAAPAGAALALYRAGDGLERPRPGHQAPIQTGTLRAGGKELVTVGVDRTAIRWSTESGAEIRRWKLDGPGLTAADGAPEASDFTIEGRRIIDSGARNGSRARREVWDLQEPIRAVAASRDGSRLFVALESGGVEILDPVARTTVADVAPPRDPLTGTLVVSPNGKLLALGRADGVVAIHRSTDGALVRQLRGHQGHVTWLTFSPDGARLYSAGADAVALAWDLQSLPEAMLPVPPASGPPAVDPTLRKRLDGEPLAGLVRTRWRPRLATTAQAARALVTTEAAVFHEDLSPALTVVADEGDVVRVSTAIAKGLGFATVDPDYAIEAYLRRADLAPVLRLPRKSEAADGTGFALREGLLLDLVGGIRPLAGSIAAFPLGLGAGDVSLSFQALLSPPAGHKLTPAGKPGKCDDAPCHFVPSPASRRAPALPPLRLRGEPAGDPHGLFSDDCTKGVDVHSAGDGATLLLTRALARAVIRVAVDRAALTHLSPCGGAGGGLASIGGGGRDRIAKKLVVWQVRGRVPALFPDGSKAGYHTGTTTELRDVTEQGDLICSKRPAFVDPICHRRALLKQVTVER